MEANGQLHTPCHFIPEKRAMVPNIYMRVGGPQSESGFSGAPAPAGTEPPTFHSLVTVTSQQSWIYRCTSKYAIY
jgi:hypothetical protein